MDFILESYSLDNPELFTFDRNAEGKTAQDIENERTASINAWQKVLDPVSWVKRMYKGKKPPIPEKYKQHKKD